MGVVSKDGSAIRREAFFSPKLHELEMARVFQDTWQFVAHESEVAEPGDYVQRTLGTDHVIISRDEDGVLRALLNACKHRGAMLCSADSGNASHFRCSYHGWTYANDGRLRGVPNAKDLYVDNPLDRRKHSLRQARVAAVYGLIFANWNPEAPPLEDYLGDAEWYLQAVFDKDLEVMGPPTRIRGRHNWKSGAENMTADLYHGPVTHHIVLSQGVSLDGDVAVAEAVANGAGVCLFSPGNAFAVDASTDQANLVKLFTQSILENGHSLITLGGYKFEKPAFIGYEGHLWEDFASRLTPDQLDYQDGMMASVGNLFPNFSWVEQFFANVDTDRPGLKFINIRAWVPISATETEQYTWTLVPKKASEDWKMESQAAFVRGLGVGGALEIDDLQNWTGMAQAGVGAISQQELNNMSAVVRDAEAAVRWPGRVYKAVLNDVGFRNFYAEWARRMGFDGEDLEPSLIPPALEGQ